jgi:hypothetical protein
MDEVIHEDAAEDGGLRHLEEHLPVAHERELLPELIVRLRGDGRTASSDVLVEPGDELLGRLENQVLAAESPALEEVSARLGLARGRVFATWEISACPLRGVLHGSRRAPSQRDLNQKSAARPSRCEGFRRVRKPKWKC